MNWLAVSVPKPPPAHLHLLAHALRAAGGRGLEIEHGESRVVAYFPLPTQPVEWMAELRAAIRSATGETDPWLETRRISEDELGERWRLGLIPRRVSPRIRIIPADGEGDPTEGSPAHDEIRIHLVPGPAFGQGDHPTTRLALSLLEAAPTSGARILDLGTGSGILALAAARLGARPVIAVESDGPSVTHARRNVEPNGLSGVVTIRELRATPELLRSLFSDLHGVMANLEPEVLLELLPTVPDLLRPGGWLLVTGIPGDELPAIRNHLARLGLEVSREREEGGWWAGLLMPGAAPGPRGSAPASTPQSGPSGEMRRPKISKAGGS